ncbi:MAG: hypothetical protein ACT4NY_32370 [Pseudonocardiales bacterium]
MSAPESDLEQARIDSLVRCGSATVVVMHLTELEETLLQRRRDRTPIVLCGAANADDGLDVEELAERDCPGCVDCFHYCPDCVAGAVRWLQRTAAATRPGVLAAR